MPRGIPPKAPEAGHCMPIAQPYAAERAPMSGKVFSRLSELIHEQCGITLSPAKKTMLEGRLFKRLRALGLPSYGAYCSYLQGPQGKAGELAHMIDAVTTNKTDFFRGPQHFEYLTARALPALVEQWGAGVRRPLNIWSAACSSGEEPYTIAVTLDHYSRTVRPLTFMLLATDVSTRMLRTAQEAIYEEERIIPVPFELRGRYFMRSRDRKKKLVRVVPEIRAQVRFRRLNFMDEDYGLREPMDIIFCRNVLIYFDRPTQQSVLKHLCRHLVPGGYLFTGHAETISGMDLPLTAVANTISRRIE